MFQVLAKFLPKFFKILLDSPLPYSPSRYPMASCWAYAGLSSPMLADLGSLLVDLGLNFDFCWILVPTWLQLGPNLAPFWLPKSAQEWSKSLQKCIQICILVLIPFLIDFWWILAPTWTSKPLQNPSKNHSLSCSTSYLRKSQKCYFHTMFLLFLLTSAVLTCVPKL